MARTHVTLIALAACLALALVAGRQVAPRELAPVTPYEYRLSEADAERDHAMLLTGELRAAGFRFAPGTAPADRDAFLAAISSGIRPDAQRLVALVDGLVTVRFGTEQEGAFGHAGPRAGRFEVLLDLPLITRKLGRRGLPQVAMHELGHVVDFALVPDALRASLNAQIPVGYQCPPGSQISACAPREERFAETFAKWATGDLGVGLYAGYAVMPPVVTLDAWGAPLAAIAAG